jgi:hypothetical protein
LVFSKDGQGRKQSIAEKSPDDAIPSLVVTEDSMLANLPSKKNQVSSKISVFQLNLAFYLKKFMI